MFKYFLILSLFLSCFSDDQPNYSKEEMLGFARAGDPNMEIKIGTIDKALVSCGEYKFPCKIGYLVVIKNLELKALYYESQDEAVESARFLKSYRARNWVFDDVVGEPILERFIVRHLKAKKQNLKHSPELNN